VFETCGVFETKTGFTENPAVIIQYKTLGFAGHHIVWATSYNKNNLDTTDYIGNTTYSTRS
jgi:hypothetical protein